MKKLVLLFALFVMACSSGEPKSQPESNMPEDGVWEVSYSYLSGTCGDLLNSGKVTISDGRVITNPEISHLCETEFYGETEPLGYKVVCEDTEGEIDTLEVETFRLMDPDMVTGISFIVISKQCHGKYLTFWVKRGIH